MPGPIRVDDQQRVAERLASVVEVRQLLEGLFAHAPVALQVYTPDGSSLVVNRACRELFGSEPPPGYNVLRDEQTAASGLTQLVARAFAGETVVVPTFWYDPRQLVHVKVAEENGRRVAISAKVFPLLDGAGKVAYVVVALRDETEAALAQQATEREREQLVHEVAEHQEALRRLARSEANLAAAQRMAHLGSWELELGEHGEPGHHPLRWSDEVFRIFGYDPDGSAATNDAFFAAVPPDDRERIAAAVRAALDGGHPYDLDHRVVRSDGTVRIVRARAELERDPATGKPIRMFGTVHDVTEARLAEDRLRASEERLRLALSAGRVVVWESDFRNDRVSFSDNAIEVMGIRPDQLTWSRTAFTGRIHPDDLAEVRALSTQVMVDGAGADFSYRFLRPDSGAAIWLEGRSQMTRDRDGTIVGARGVLVDVTARRAAEELRQHSVELEARNRRIEEASRLKSEFLANMSHELRTPLNAILGFAELLHDGIVDPESPQHREFLGDILSSGQHLLQLINDVLDLAKVEAGRLELRPEPVDLPALVAEVCSILRPTAAARAITVEHQLDPALTELVLDPSRLKQVLYNYLSNALKFTPEGGRVIIRATAAGDDRLRLEVEDDGVGIAPDDLNRLFLDFQQLDGGPGKRHPGTGLGLALTRRLVEAQGGEVGVRSEPGVGSVFHAILPRRAVAGAPRLRPRRDSTAGFGA